MQSWLPHFGEREGPKYLAIAGAIEQAITSGVLRPGARLPPQRDLASALAVDLTTVTKAYGILRDAGLIEGAGRLGSYVRNAASRLTPAAATADTAMIMPPQPGFAFLADVMKSGMAKLLRAGGQSPLLQYQPAGGTLHDRLQAAAAMTAYGLPADEGEVMITAGGQNALHAILGTVLVRGDAVCAGRHVYPGMLALATRFGLTVIPIDGDDEGLDPDMVVRAARRGAKAIYVVPTNDNPTTVTMSLSRRMAIAKTARDHGLTIVEDDAYGRLPAAPLPPIARFAPECSWHVASTSKIISPVLRVAHVRAPSSRAAARLSADIHETAVMAPPLNAAMVSAWISDGTLAKLIAAVRTEGIVRQKIVARHLKAAPYHAHPEGYHLWVPLGAGMDAVDLVGALRPSGLSIVASDSFAVDGSHGAPAVRISIGGVMDHDGLRRLIERLDKLLQPRKA
jgi:DNA-binding transcriptional MocR family regulator